MSARSIQARIPAGVKDGQRIRVKGKGSAGANGGPAGDLFVSVKVSPHRLFSRKGDNLTLDVPVSFDEAALGADVKIPTLGGTPVTVKVPPGTPNGRTFRVRGKGARKADGTVGDLLATIEIQVPSHLDEAARAAVEAYRDAQQAARAEKPLRAGLFQEPVMAGRAPFPPPGPDAAVYVISVAAQLTGLHPQTLRTYERMGLITPGRTGGGGRRYSGRDLELLREISDLTSSGIGIEGVRRILELENRVAALASRNDELQADLDAAHEALRQACCSSGPQPGAARPRAACPSCGARRRARPWSSGAAAASRVGVHVRRLGRVARHAARRTRCAQVGAALLDGLRAVGVHGGRRGAGATAGVEGERGQRDHGEAHGRHDPADERVDARDRLLDGEGQHEADHEEETSETKTHGETL